MYVVELIILWSSVNKGNVYIAGNNKYGQLGIHKGIILILFLIYLESNWNEDHKDSDIILTFK